MTRKEAVKVHAVLSSLEDTEIFLEEMEEFLGRHFHEESWLNSDMYDTIINAIQKEKESLEKELEQL